MKLLKRIINSLFIFFLLVIIGLVYIFQIEPSWIRVKEIGIRIPNLEMQFEGLKIVQISDIHVNDWMTKKRLNRIIQLVNDQSPDVIAITGDFVTEERPFNSRQLAPDFTSNKQEMMGNREISLDFVSEVKLPEMLELTSALSQLKPRFQTFAVLGNHDYSVSASRVREVLRKSGIVELNNQIYPLRQGKATLYFAGIDDIIKGKPDLRAVLAQLPQDESAILLVHEPDFADKTGATGRFSLQLSGHSHGGQIRLPLFGAPILPKDGQKYPLGLEQIAEMSLYTNPGVGMVKPKVRFNCRPEITVFTLQVGKGLSVNKDKWYSLKL